MITEFKIYIHHDRPLSKKTIKGYVREAVASWKGGYHPDDVRRAIKRATFKRQEKRVCEHSGVTLDDPHEGGEV